jgi:hypothetical protein
MENEKVQPVKLHRRHVDLDGRAFTVLTLRPSTECRYATNYFHQTWHVLTDPSGARLLGRLCWSLAFQRREGTIVVIDHPLIVPNPFDADKSSPIVIVNSDLAPLNRTAISQLKRHLARKKRSEGTVRLSTSGLDRMLAADPAGDLLELQQQSSGVWWNDHQRRGWTDRVNGVVVLAAPSPVLQWLALWLSQLGSHWYRGSDYSELDHPMTRRGTGEVQVFENFATMVTQAIATRESLFPGAPHRIASLTTMSAGLSGQRCPLTTQSLSENQEADATRRLVAVLRLHANSMVSAGAAFTIDQATELVRRVRAVP